MRTAAWFDDHKSTCNAKGKCTTTDATRSLASSHGTFGAWSQHRPVLEHYSVVAVNMPVVLHTEQASGALSRHSLVVDQLHLSHAGQHVC